MNPLQLLPMKVRAVFYALFGLFALFVMATAAYYGAISEAHTPDWVLGLGGVVVALTPVFSAVATGNVSTSPTPVAVTGPAEVTPLEDLDDRSADPDNYDDAADDSDFEDPDELGPDDYGFDDGPDAPVADRIRELVDEPQDADHEDTRE